MVKIKQYRIKNHVTQQTLANLIGVSSSSYSKKENDIIKFSLNEAKIISDFFGKTIENIFFGK